MAVDTSLVQDMGKIVASLGLHPPRNEAEADRLYQIQYIVTDLGPALSGYWEALDLLTSLLSGWEARHSDPSAATPQDVLRFLMEQNGLRQQDLVPDVFPARSQVADFLRGARPLTYERALRLARFFGISPAAFYPASTDATTKMEAS